jgi:hypothetical protein
VLDPSSFDGKRLADALASLWERPDTLLAMGAAAQSLARPDAASQIIDACQGLIGSPAPSQGPIGSRGPNPRPGASSTPGAPERSFRRGIS